MSTDRPEFTPRARPAPVIRCYHHVHLVSDSTGETLMNVMKASMSHFPRVATIEHLYALVRSERQMARVLKSIEMTPGLVLFTLVDPGRRQALEACCAEIGAPAIAILDPLMASLARHLGQPTQLRAGVQHGLNQDYYRRIEALDFAMAHDDGQKVETLNEADVVLVGVSRTSKTPTCIYLAHRGVRAGNVPLVHFDTIPKVLDDLTRPLVVGLTLSPDRLVQIRRNRLNTLNENRPSDYADKTKVRREVSEATRYFETRGWPVIDVTRRSVEETAAKILNHLADRQHGISAL